MKWAPKAGTSFSRVMREAFDDPSAIEQIKRQGRYNSRMDRALPTTDMNLSNKNHYRTHSQMNSIDQSKTH